MPRRRISPRARRAKLSEIEDSAQLATLKRVAAQASKGAIRRAKRFGREITYLDKGWVVVETATGRKRKVAQVKSVSQNKRPAGARYTIS